MGHVSRSGLEIGPGFTPEQEAEIRERHSTDTELFSNMIACAREDRFSDEYLGKMLRNYLPTLERDLNRLRAAASENSPQQSVPERPERMPCKHGVRWPHDCSDCEQELAQRIAPASSELARLREFQRKIEEAEARCCPEDVGFEEWIGVLKRQVGERDVQIGTLTAAINAMNQAPNSATSPTKDGHG